MNKLITLLFHDVYRDAPSESGFQGPGADRYKLGEEAFNQQLRAIYRERSDAPVLASELHLPQSKAAPFAISVDDGGISYYSLIADSLEAYGWRGHCFVTTGRIGHKGFLQANHLRELHARGHLIGSHSVSHPERIHTCSPEELRREWRESRQSLEDILGERVSVGSVPGGFYSPAVAEAAREAGLDILFTSEPLRSPANHGGCLLLGRYALRHDSPPDLAGRLVAQDQGLLVREWLVWNSKKALKNTLGPGYGRLTGWLSRPS